MNYYLNLFSPETFDAFKKNGCKISGFRKTQKGLAKNIKEGDIFLCYMTRLSRWCGLLEIKTSVFENDDPIFEDPDPFVLRFKVNPLVILENETSIPIMEDFIWNRLTDTKDQAKGAPRWAVKFRGSMRNMSIEDGKFLETTLKEQNKKKKIYSLTDKDIKQLNKKVKIKTKEGSDYVEIPDKEDENIQIKSSPKSKLESTKIQSAISEIGVKLGFNIWVARDTKSAVLENIKEEHKEKFIDTLPLNYETATLKTIENIDVIWIKNRSIIRAFEIEHTTSIYSGLLRMADLLALQPNMAIALHIIAPDEKREKVFKEINRPVFSLLESGSLSKKCTYLSYESIMKLKEIGNLEHTKHSIIEEYEEYSEE